MKILQDMLFFYYKIIVFIHNFINKMFFITNIYHLKYNDITNQFDKEQYSILYYNILIILYNNNCLKFLFYILYSFNNYNDKLFVVTFKNEHNQQYKIFIDTTIDNIKLKIQNHNNKHRRLNELDIITNNKILTYNNEYIITNETIKQYAIDSLFSFYKKKLFKNIDDLKMIIICDSHNNELLNINNYYIKSKDQIINNIIKDNNITCYNQSENTQNNYDHIIQNKLQLQVVDLIDFNNNYYIPIINNKIPLYKILTND